MSYTPGQIEISSQRLSWIDQARGIAMLLVILGHSPIYPELSSWIYSFHVPLFFFLSGYLYNNKKYPGFRSIFLSRFKTLIIPYLFFSVVGFVFMITRLCLKGAFSVESAITAVVGSIFGIRDTSDYNGTLWFLPALLMTELIYAGLNQAFAGNRRLQFAASSVISLVGILLLTYFKFRPFVFNLDIAIIVLVIFSAGNLTRIEFANIKLGALARRVILIILSLLSLIFSQWNGWVSAFHFVFGNPILYYSGAAVGIPIIIALSKSTHSRILEFIGRNSLTFLALHQYVVLSRLYSIQQLLPLKIMENAWVLPLRSITFLGLGAGLVFPIAYALERWLPGCIGKPPRSAS